jgi:glutaredoxin
MVSAMHVELLWWDGCPSQPRALSDLRATMVELGLDPDTVEVHQIEIDSEARREGFIGSPTIRINGIDVSPTEGEPYGLNCRVYHRRDGRISPTPDPADLRDALSAAMNTRP